MSKTMKYVGTAALVMGGVLLVNKLTAANRPIPSRPQNFPTTPQAPAPPQNNNAQKWEQWVNTVISIYGNVKELWEPGGPFYKGSYDNTDPAVQENLLPNYDNYA